MARGLGPPALALRPLPALVALAAACARMEPPPGGPPDTAPPRVLATVPESLAVVPGFDGEVEFRFGEVVSEGSTPSEGLGTGDLERLIILSPDSQVPRVSWRRTRITVRPRSGWRPNTVYRVELLPGLLDLRRNRADSGRVVTFTTGAPLPTATLTGRIGDWTTGRAVPRALVEAVLFPDSLAYRAVADSSGRFRIGPLPAGEYRVYGVVDQNNDRRRQPREPWDSVRVAPGDTTPVALWAFPRDTVGPRVQGVAFRDTLTAVVTFTQHLDPTQRLDSTVVTVMALPDSTPVPVRSLLPRAVHDSLYAPPPAPADSAAAPGDSVPAAPADTGRLRRPLPPGRADTTRVRRVVPPAPADTGRAAGPAAADTVFARKPLEKDLVLRVARPLEWDRSYVIRVAGIRNVNGVAADATGGLVVPKAPAPTDSVAVPAPEPAAEP